MALYRSLPVYKATYSLLLSVQRMVPNMQRDVRYTLGQGLTKLLMNMIGDKVKIIGHTCEYVR